MKTNKSDYADTHIIDGICFWWKTSNTEVELRLHNRTYNDALAIAMEQGYREPKWYKPWTWNNIVVTVG